MPELTHEDRAAIRRLRETLWQVVRMENCSPAVSLVALCHVVGMVIGKTRRHDAPAAVNMVAVATNAIPMYATAYTLNDNPLID